jgi:hypothetical protein
VFERDVPLDGGGVCSLAESDDTEGLLRLADIALCRAKRSGRNATFRHVAGSSRAAPVRR